MVPTPRWRLVTLIPAASVPSWAAGGGDKGTGLPRQWRCGRHFSIGPVFFTTLLRFPAPFFNRAGARVGRAGGSRRNDGSIVMNKILLATTALFALSGISVAAADISISGHVRYHYDSWSDEVEDAASASGNNNNATSTDLNIWVKGKTVTDGGLTIAPEARLESAANGGTRHYIKLMDDWGTLILGNHHSPVYTMSLGADWRGTVSGVPGPVGTKVGDNGPSAGKVMENSGGTKTTGHSATKMIYMTPNFGGFKAGLAIADAGATSKADATDFIVQYGLGVMGDGNLTVSYGSSNQNAKDGNAASTSAKNSELGLALTKGPFLVSVVQLSQQKTPEKELTGTREVNKQSGNEIEVAYDATDNLKLSVVMFNAKVDKDLDNKGDKFSSTGLGAKYTIAPGLWTSVGYNSFKFTDAKGTTAGLKGKMAQNKGSSYRIRVHASF